MKLLSATVRNYRIIQDRSVEFDDECTLIRGTNETGKSTFMEAIHRGLFLKSKVTGSLQKDMLPDGYAAGPPEVEVAITAKGATYRVFKRFAGNNGTTQLVEEGGKTRHNEEADAFLSELLQVADSTEGKATQKKLEQLWAHLWVWQGKAGDHPSESAAAQKDSLIQRLQESGGAGAIQSGRDSRVSDQFNAQSNKFYQQNGKVRKNSELSRAQDDEQRATEDQRNADTRRIQLEQAVVEFEQAKQSIEQCEANLEELGTQLEDVAKRRAAADKLQTQLEKQQGDARQLAEKHDQLKKADQQIQELRSSLQGLEKELAPKVERETKLKEQLAAGKERQQKAEQTNKSAAQAVQAGRARRDLARAWVEQFEKAAQHAKLAEQSERAGEHRKEIETHRHALAELPGVNYKAFKKIQTIHTGLEQAKVALQAMAAGIEVVSTDLAVTAGEQELQPGDHHTASEVTDLRIGDTVHLRIHPGGGDSLSDARDEVHDLQQELSEALDAAGVSDLEHASEVVAQRRDLETRRKEAEARLKSMDDGSLADELATADDALKKATAEVQRRSSKVEAFTDPVDREAAGARMEKEEQTLSQAETAQEQSEEAYQEAKDDTEAAEEQLQELVGELTEQKQQIQAQQSELDVLIKQQGEDVARATSIQEAATAQAQSEAVLQATQVEMDQLEPAQLERDEKRLKKAREKTTSQLSDAQKKLGGSERLLRRDGSEDPQKDLQNANARLEQQRQYRESIERQARAMQMLSTLFQEEQRDLSDQFTQPLADKISVYLQCVFGPAAKAEVTFEDGSFKGIELSRSAQGGRLDFHTLSGGTKEQVASAVRLAIAEVLAEDYGGHLPIVLDEAFAFSDQGRLQRLQRMLDLAVENGLQVIVLTSDASDYGALGAEQVTFTTPVATPAPAAAEQAVEPTSAGTDDEPARPPRPAGDSGSDQEAFLNELRRQGGSSGNKTLQEALGWSDRWYADVKAQLIADGRIVPGKGRGGSVSLNE